MKIAFLCPYAHILKIGLRICSLVLLFTSYNFPSIAQQFMRIAAIVNEEIISGYDLKSRMDLVILSSQLPNNADIRGRIGLQVLNRLINETLELQEVKRKNIKVSRKRIKFAIGQVEKQNKLTKGGMLKLLNAQNIDPHTFERRIEAEIGWGQLIRNELSRMGGVDNEAINQQIELKKANKGKPEYLVAEIYISFDTVKTSVGTEQLVDRLYRQLKSGARFDGLARSFSQSASATRAGNLGWIREDQLDPELAKEVSKMTRGELSKPIKSADGYYILQLKDKRLARGLTQNDVSVSIHQIFLPLDKSAPKAAVQAQFNLARSVSMVAQNCKDMEMLEKEIGTGESGKIEVVKLSNLAPYIKEPAQYLDVGKASTPIRTDAGIVVFMVCSRTSDIGEANIRRQISRRLSMQRAELISRRRLIDLRRAAFIEIRK